MRLLLSLAVFFLLLAKIDRLCLKASRGFCRHFIDVPLQPHPEWQTKTHFPADLFKKPFYFLGKGSQTFVFESADKTTILKLYKYPSHMRRFGFVSHPLGYHFSPKRIALKKHNLERWELSYNSYFLAHQHLPSETGVSYIHLNPTTHLRRSIDLRDKTGRSYKLPLDQLGFVVQKKGSPFLPLLKKTLDENQQGQARLMIDSLFQLIASRCSKGITDLDNMDHDNYGWADGHAIHLDIGRFKQKKNIQLQDELGRVTAPLKAFLQKNSPELLDYYLERLRLERMRTTSASEV